MAERQEFDVLNPEIDDLLIAEAILGAEISIQADAQPSRDLNAFLTSIQEGTWSYIQVSRMMALLSSHWT